jgi:hypothetical protein
VAGRPRCSGRSHRLDRQWPAGSEVQPPDAWANYEWQVPAATVVQLSDLGDSSQSCALIHHANANDGRWPTAGRQPSAVDGSLPTLRRPSSSATADARKGPCVHR